MAFNFNWSPLTADANFYKRATDLLTTALNKSPKPPIIVDDILVTELNLGSVPPDLEILEIGDIAEDRFRGIFKMCYSGNAFLTLKTRVQANPMNTYLSSKTAFTSPQPLAAASGLTIPLQITLSEIKLSAFIILVFSRQKGLTLVFRNDPLESLKVSSTFDSIQFVRDYLQTTIESKLRDLMMDELPAIIHRLSLQLWCPDYRPKEDTDVPKEEDEQVVDPLANPPSDAVDANGNLLDANDVSSIAANGGAELQSLFSQKNLVRLATLTNTHRTMSLFTPGINDTVFRAWTGQFEKTDGSPSPPFATPSLMRSQSWNGGATTYTFSDTSSQGSGQFPIRPSIASIQSATTGLSLGANRAKSHTGRKRKHRVVNLRRDKSASAPASDVGDVLSDTTSVAGPSTEPLVAESIPEEPEEEQAMANSVTPNRSVRFRTGAEHAPLPLRAPLNMSIYSAPDTRAPAVADDVPARIPEASSSDIKPRPVESRRGPASDTSSVILEQAWIMKMAGEIARRVYDEKQRNPSFWEDRDDSPPPAYEAR